MIVILSGSSGAGKNTIINRLIEEDGEKYYIMPTVTTRKMREGEREGFPYFFVTTEEFLSRAESGEFYEYENVHGNLYGTSKIILDGLLGGDKILLKDIDVFGTQNLVDKLKGVVNIVTVFITVDKEELKSRLHGRGEKSEDIDKRLMRFTIEQAFKDKYDYVIENHDLDTTVESIKKIIRAEQAKRADK